MVGCVSGAYSERTGRQQLHDILRDLQQHVEDRAAAAKLGIHGGAVARADVAEQEDRRAHQIQSEEQIHTDFDGRRQQVGEPSPSILNIHTLVY